VTHARRALTTIALTAAAFTGALTAVEPSAHADVRVRVGGTAHVSVGGGVRVRAPRVRWVRLRRPAPPPLRVHVGGAIWVGGGYYGPRFAPPPPPPPVATCDCGPGYYYPVQPAPTPYVVASAPVVRPPLPRWGLGIGAGGVSVEGNDAGSDLALLGHFRLTPGLILEGEIGKNELADGTRVDRRLGASLLYEFGAYNRWAPYLLGGLGVAQVDVGGGEYQTSQNFGEVGVGLRLAVTRHVHVAADIRAGSRSASDEAQPLDTQLRSVTPTPDESEEYTRARLSGVLYF